MGQGTGQDSAKSLKRRRFCPIFIIFHFLMRKALPEVTLASLRDRSRGCGEPQKAVLSSYFDYFSLSNAKRFKIKTFLEVSLASERDRSRGCEEPRKRVLSWWFFVVFFLLLLLFFHFLMQKDWKWKHFLKVSLASSTLIEPTVFKNFWKNSDNFAVLGCCTVEK